MSEMSISMCENDGVPSVMTMCSAQRGVGDAVGDRQRAGRVDAVERLLGAGLVERHPRVADRLQAVGILVDAEHGEPAIGERDGEREPDPAEPDDGDLTA